MENRAELVSRSFWKGKRVLLTGNTGFKGSWLALWLLDMGAEVYGYALAPSTEPNLFSQLKLDKEMPWVEADIRDLDSILVALREAKPEIVIHMAAQPLVRDSYVDPVGTYQTNIMGTINLLEAVRQCNGVVALVNVTTDKCYENREWAWGYRENEALGGHDPYSSSKACSEIVASAYYRSFFSKSGELGLATARAGNVIGGGDYSKDRLIPDILRAIQSGKQVVIRSPNAIRPWQHVLEPLSGYLKLAESLYANRTAFSEAWNFGPNDQDAQTVEWIVKRLCAMWPENHGYVIQGDERFHEANYLKLEISKARQRLAWHPTWGLETALTKIVEWTPAQTAQQIRQFEADGSQ